MNVDPRIIADMMTEDPDQFNQMQPPAQQPQQPAQSDINMTPLQIKRVLLMMQLVNIANRADLPLTAEAYNKLGRSKGFVRNMIGRGPWMNFVMSEQFEQLAGNLSMETKEQIVREMILSVY